MAPGLARFESALPENVKTVHIDVDKQETPEFERYLPLLKARSQNSIPYTALLGKDDKLLVDWIGLASAEKLAEDTRTALDQDG